MLRQVSAAVAGGDGQIGLGADGVLASLASLF